MLLLLLLTHTDLSVLPMGARTRSTFWLPLILKSSAGAIDGLLASAAVLFSDARTTAKRALALLYIYIYNMGRAPYLYIYIKLKALLKILLKRLINNRQIVYSMIGLLFGI